MKSNTYRYNSYTLTNRRTLIHTGIIAPHTPTGNRRSIIHTGIIAPNNNKRSITQTGIMAPHTPTEEV